MEKKYNDYLKEYKDNMLEWVEKYGMSFNQAFDSIKDFVFLAPIDYRDGLIKDLKKWSLENEKLARRI